METLSRKFILWFYLTLHFRIFKSFILNKNKKAYQISLWGKKSGTMFIRENWRFFLHCFYFTKQKKIMSCVPTAASDMTSIGLIWLLRLFDNVSWKFPPPPPLLPPILTSTDETGVFRGEMYFPSFPGTNKNIACVSLQPSWDYPLLLLPFVCVCVCLYNGVCVCEYVSLCVRVRVCVCLNRNLPSSFSLSLSRSDWFPFVGKNSLAYNSAVLQHQCFSSQWGPQF